MEYNRHKAVEYAHRWAYMRNPLYMDFSGMGGDCTNFVSQCVYAGAPVMNGTPTYGWYYYGPENRAPAWSGVKYFHRFLISNQGPGPYAQEVDIREIQPGDVIQLATVERDFHHMVLVVSVGEEPAFHTIRIAAHTDDADNRLLSSYPIRMIRFLHIVGVRPQKG